MLADFLAGGAGGLCLLAVGQPFDTVKVRMQTQNHIYKNAISCVKTTLAKEGPTAFYKGVAPMVIAPVFALSFMGYEHGKQIFGSDSYTKLALAGAWSGLYTTAIIGPGERIKCVTQTTDKYGKGSLAVMKGLYAEGGLRTVCRGMGMTLTRDGIGGAFYYGLYETLKRKFKERSEKEELSVAENLLAGGLSGVFMWSIVYPFDLIKSRIQTAPESMGRADVIKEVKSEISAKGVGKVCYRGIGVVLLRAFPANAACFLGYEKTKKALKNLGIN